MTLLTDYYENDLRPKVLAAARQGYQAEIDRVRALDTERKADSERVERLLASRPGWQKAAGYVDVAALRQQEQDEWAQEAARSLRASRGERWRAYVGEHPNSVDRWGQPRDYDPDSPPDWFE